LGISINLASGFKSRPMLRYVSNFCTLTGVDCFLLMSVATFYKLEDYFLTGDGIVTVERISCWISSSGTSNLRSFTDSYLLYIGTETLQIISNILLLSEFGIIADKAVSSFRIAVAFICYLYCRLNSSSRSSCFRCWIASMAPSLLVRTVGRSTGALSSPYSSSMTRLILSFYKSDASPKIMLKSRLCLRCL
jgi:hypothetical protein